MLADGSSASETSPLLGSGGSNGQVKPSRVDGTIDHEAGNDDEHADLERHSTRDSDREAQFKGNPEMQKRLKYIILAVSIGVFLSAADQTIIVSSYGKIGSELNALNLTSWIATSYFLTLTSFQPLYGKLSDIFGRKPCLLFSYLVFGIGCLFCGLSQDIYQLVAARVFQGIGGGGMTTVVSILLSDIVPLQERGLWQGIINIIYAAGSSSGAPLGGLLADSIGWRWAFIGQVPLCLLSFIAVIFLLHLPAEEQKDWKTNVKRIDFLGAFVLLLAVLGMLIGLDRGSNVAWSIPISYGPLIASIFLFALFIVVEVKVTSEPFAPGHIIFERSLLAGYLCNFFSLGGYLALLYFLPLFYQATEGRSATGASLLLIPGIILGVSGSLFGGYLIKRTGKYYWINLVGYSLLSVGAALVFLLSGPITVSTIGMVIGQMMGGFGAGIGITTCLIALISNAAPADQAVTTACSYLFRTLGTVVGISLTSTLVQNSLRGILRARLSQNKDIEEIVDGVRRSLDYVNKLSPEVRAIVRGSYGDAVVRGFGLVLLFTVCAAVSSLFIREKRLNR